MEPILLNDLLQISASEIDNYKIRFMQFNGEVNPMDEYLREPELINTQWLLWRTKQRYFSVVIITRLQVHLFKALSLSISIWSPLIRPWSPVKRAMLDSAWPILKKNYWF